MKLSVNEKGTVIIKQLYEGLLLESGNGENFEIRMQDNGVGFEFSYEGTHFIAYNGQIKVVPNHNQTNIVIENDYPVIPGGEEYNFTVAKKTLKSSVGSQVFVTISEAESERMDKIRMIPQDSILLPNNIRGFITKISKDDDFVTLSVLPEHAEESIPALKIGDVITCLR